jgi:RHS repeat-associated protein
MPAAITYFIPMHVPFIDTRNPPLASTGTAVGYTGLFPLCCVPFFTAKAAKEKRIESPYLLLGRKAPLKKCLLARASLSNLIKKEFDQEGDQNGANGIDAYHFGFRMYDPVTGVWMTRDPRRQFWNPYSYAGNGKNPINNIDVNGLELRLYFSESGPGGIGYHSFIYSTELDDAVGRHGSSGIVSGPGWERKFVEDESTFYIVIDDLNGMTEKEAFDKLYNWSGWNKGEYLWWADDCQTQMQEAFAYAGLEYPENNPGLVAGVGESGEALLEYHMYNFIALTSPLLDLIVPDLGTGIASSVWPYALLNRGEHLWESMWKPFAYDFRYWTWLNKQLYNFATRADAKTGYRTVIRTSKATGDTTSFDPRGRQ